MAPSHPAGAAGRVALDAKMSDDIREEPTEEAVAWHGELREGNVNWAAQCVSTLPRERDGRGEADREIYLAIGTVLVDLNAGETA